MLSEIIEKILIEKAKKKETISYRELAEEINRLSEKKIPTGRFLGVTLSRHLHKICEKYYREGKGMLGSIVVNKKSGIPSDGFFRFAQELYSIDLKTDEEKRKFWQNEIKKVFRELKN
ncbi:hypothetical protein SAMN06265182_1645 [Persephonella hydrogeniphila]|uniref:Uncharacterized protein n=1 Tax=Persephonella hydrogeniphila TaxID=198703 RepID=A0A285NK64_9AQUI|nr:hypothetical protein [Persephonella hydrogeniphila]SNZ09882.1 hypothetical protein SAMN06265182_1645 [Persephonella hydrogeniphila]